MRRTLGKIKIIRVVTLPDVKIVWQISGMVLAGGKHKTQMGEIDS